MTQFWGMLFGINFAMGVATGITMEFQFGMNWALLLALCRRHLRRAAGDRRADGVLPRGDLRRPVLLRLGQALASVGHLVVTWLVALGSNLSALWILIANGWMQNPVGADFNPAHDAHGGHRLHRGALQSGRAGEVRAHGVAPAMSSASMFVLGDQRLVPAAGPPRRSRQALDDGGRQLRPRLGAVGRRARRRERLHRRPRTRR